MSGRRLQEKMEKKRHLEANTNKDIAKLEAYFGTSMEVNLASLPTVGVHTPSPWPGPYWPTYQDGINVIWSPGEASPAEKYATAFGLDVTDFMDKVSKDNGIDSMSSHTVCSSDSDCSSLTDGSSCAIRTGKSSGYCIPTWYGICHAWTPAAMLETEPRCAVTYNGVTFQPMDLKALVSDVYDGATVSTVFTGTRYNGGTDSTDEYGRHSSDSYRDLNPAFFHIAAANLLGKLNATFIADVTAGSEVWNQPVRGFKVYEQTNMTLKEAASTFYGLDEYPWNAAAKSIVYVKARMSWIFETYTDGALVSTGKVQDAYTLRCAPQVHGIVHDTINFVRGVLDVEMNSATDNPMVFTGSAEVTTDLTPSIQSNQVEVETEQLKEEAEITDLDGAKQEIKRLKALVEQKQKPVEHPAAGMKRTSDTFYRGGGGFVISGGNFHGEYPAKVLDYLAIGIHEIASVSERRIERLVNPTLSNLPAFLVPEGGLNSGFMIAHCTAAALVSENKVLTHPSSVDSISTSGAKEDHVSMGGYAARKALTVVEHVETVVAIEILAACQALDLLRPLRTTEALEAVHALVRTRVAKFDKDRVMKPDIDAVLELVRSGAICEVVAPFLAKLHETGL
ncbi:hypothetical protein ON010_g9247 [Phytophthora cinnamomi]|nr:hypothetical protein ON010_g9247 [Phytophthora cinnamomi]